MRQRLLRFFAVGAVLVSLVAPGTGRAGEPEITLKPNQVPNGIASASGEQFHQRFDITLDGGAAAASRAFTITLPPEVSLVANSITATSNDAAAIAFYSGAPSASTLAFGLTGTVASKVITVEFDVATPTTFTGISEGAKVDTVYAFDFSTTANQTDTTEPVAKHQNRRLQAIQFSAPDSTNGDTTSAGGRFYKLSFPSVLADLSHTGISGLSASRVFADNTTDVLYSFYLSTDSSLVVRSTESAVSFYTLGADRTPLPGSRQSPRFVPGTFIREDFTTTFAASAADSVNAMITLADKADGSVYYVYVLADPAPDRSPSARLSFGGSAKKGYDAGTFGAFSGGVFLGRSGPLRVEHPPEFTAVGWEFDDDSGVDDYSSTGVIQVPSDIVGMAAVDGNRKDNRNITVDSGSFLGKGDAFAGYNNGVAPDPISEVSLLFAAQDADNSGGFQMRIFLSTQDGMGAGDLVGSGLDSLKNSTKISGTDTLGISSHVFTFSPIVRDSATNQIDAARSVVEGDYYVYFAATDGSDAHRVVTQVKNDPYIDSPTSAKLLVRHAPNLTVDTFSLNDFGGDGDLDVITGIDVSQMITDTDGQNLSAGPATRYVTISWGGSGIDGDLDVDHNATIDLYYSTRSDFNDVRGSLGYTSGNSAGADLLAAVSQGNNDTHKIGSTTEDADGQFDNQYTWDLWSYVSSESTIPMTGVRYYLYALMTGGSTKRLVSMTRDGNLASTDTDMAVNFLHPPYIRASEPAEDMVATVNEPVLVSWEAMDVDNGEAGGQTANPSGLGRTVSNSRTTSPNIRILLTSADFGEVTTWASITNNNTLWLGNSGDGGYTEEVELNEGVDTSFVIVGNRMRNSLINAAALETNSGVGRTYYVYLAIDDGRDGSVADAVTTSPQGTNFGARSPVVRAPGRVTFTSTVPTNPPSNIRFVIPTRMTAVSEEVVKYAIAPDDGNPSGTKIETVNLYISVDTSRFEPVDMNTSTPDDIEPFSLGTNSQIVAGNVSQMAYRQGDQWRLDFIYSDLTTGLTFFDGQQPLAFANLRAKNLSGASTVNTTISLDKTGSRVSKMRDDDQADVGASIPEPTEVTISRRSQLAGRVRLQGRASSADTVTFFLREVGSFTSLTDSLFNLNDIDSTTFGVQDTTTGANGEFTLTNVPPGRWIISAAVPRHLTGQDTIDVSPGQDLTGVQPTRDGDGIDWTYLLAGDAAGYTDSNGNSVPDNFIDSADINAINAALFKQYNETGYNTYADVNRDSIVNGADKDYATANRTSNTGQAGYKRPVFPTFKPAVPEGGNADALVTLTGLPEGEVRAGETFDVTIQASGVHAVRTYEVHVDFDPTKLMVVDVSGGSLLESYLTDLSGKVLGGDVGLVNSVLGLTPVGATGEGTLATVRFRAIGRAAETRLELGDALLIDVEHIGAKPKVEGEGVIVLSDDPIVYHDADGDEIRGLVLPTVDPKVDFNDFMILARCFGTKAGSADFDLRADLNADNQIDFADFLILASDFGRSAVDAPASSRLAKPASIPGANPDAELSLNVEGKARIGETLTLLVDLSGADRVQGWGLTVSFDPDRYAFVEATAPDEAGLLAPDALMLVHEAGPGEITLASGIGGEAAAGEGALALLTFRPKGEFEEARFEISDGIVFDPDDLSNLVDVLQTLDIRPVPAEFALFQNYPNPFNPETTIGYDLAADSRVRLDVYNVMGQLINTLVSEDQAAGRYRAVWSGRDAQGYQVASGVYFYRLQTDGFKSVRKLLLLK